MIASTNTFNAMTTTLEPIAIIGVAFKLPQGAEDEASLWEILEKGKNVMTPWPESRANVDAFYKPEANLKNTVCIDREVYLWREIDVHIAYFFLVIFERRSFRQ